MRPSCGTPSTLWGTRTSFFSSDYPHHDSEFPESVKEFLGHDDLTDEAKRKVLWDNCAALYAIRS